MGSEVKRLSRFWFYPNRNNNFQASSSENIGTIGSLLIYIALGFELRKSQVVFKLRKSQVGIFFIGR
jgi:hypothetical protein